MSLARVIGFISSLVVWLGFSASALAQSATNSASGSGSKGGTELPNAGTTDITYFLFIFGIALFVIGTIKVVLSFRD